MTNNLHPTVIYFAAAAVLGLFPCKRRGYLLLASSVMGLWAVHLLDPGIATQSALLDLELSPLRVDRLSKVFGYIFALNSIAAALFALHLQDARQQLAALLYIGSAIGSAFAGDMLTLYVFWEMMAVSSTFLILARQSRRAQDAGLRYILMHLFGGLVMLIGIIIHFRATGSLGFAAFAPGSAGSWMILIGILVNASAVPFSSWLSDSYPEATVTGGVILSAYTTKAAVYALLRGYPGWDALIVVGCVMTVYGIIYALLENDMRRILAYSITNQVGFMVTGAGIGTALAVNGAAAHAFCHIIYKSLLWMSAGAVLAMTGRSKCTELGGLHKTMPWTLALGLIGALAISSFPGTSGFTSKSMIIQAAADSHLTWVLFILEVASAGVFLHAGIKFPYFVFFAKDRGLRPREAPRHMLLAMGIPAFLCIYLGIHPEPLYGILPYEVGGFNVYEAGKVVAQLQLLMSSALTFFLMLPMLKRTDTIAIELDWFYRKGGRVLYSLLDYILNHLNDKAAAVGGRLVGALLQALRWIPALLTAVVTLPGEINGRARGALSSDKIRTMDEALMTGTLPVGATLLSVACGLAVLLLLVL